MNYGRQGSWARPRSRWSHAVLVDTGTALAAGTIHCLLGDLISGHRAVQCTVGDAFTEHGVIEKYMLPKKIFVTPSI